MSVTLSGFYPLMPNLQWFRFASPPACGLVSPSGFLHWLKLTYRGSALLHRLSVVLLPFGDYTIVNGPLGSYPLSPALQGFRFAPPPVCSLAPLRGLFGSE